MSGNTKVLAGKCALVTGASSGLGRHFAHVLAGAGANVVLAARRQDLLREAAREVEALGGSCATVELNVCSHASVETAVATAVRQYGRLDILINNAGVTITKPVLQQSEQEWDRVLDTNLKGAFLVAQAAARQMSASPQGGAIVNVASILGLRQAAQVTPYAVSKAATIQLTKQLALELARVNVRVNALAPGYIETDLNREFFASAEGQAMIKRIPQRRLGSPADLDGALLLLAGDASRYMSGCVIVVDGGHSVSGL